MTLTAADIMQKRVVTVAPSLDLPELERRFLAERVSGFPVVENGRLVGVVARSDVVRQICVERSIAEQLSDFYRDEAGFAAPATPVESFTEIALRVGRRIDALTVGDVMSPEPVTVPAGAGVVEVARVMVDRHVHRLPVVEDGRLAGIVSSLDLVRIIAEGRLVPDG